jgi:hypothetical protein
MFLIRHDISLLVALVLTRQKHASIHRGMTVSSLYHKQMVQSEAWSICDELPECTKTRALQSISGAVSQVISDGAAHHSGQTCRFEGKK